MSTPALRVVAKADSPSFLPDPSCPAQLCLFDFRPRYRALCFPMRDMHGRAFVRAVLHHRPDMIVDVRSHPYFNLYALERDSAFAAFKDASAVYRHYPLDLRPASIHADRWRLMKDATSLFEKLASKEAQQRIFAFLVHHRSEADLLAGAMFKLTRGDECWEMMLL